jgi:hypothetical protein
MRPNGKITIDGESYDLREYMAPKNFVALVLAAKLYLTRDAIGYSDFVYQFKMSDNFTFDDVAFANDEQGFEIVKMPEKDKLEARVFTDKDLLTPAQFNQFFNLFNDNQRGDSFPALSTTEINVSNYLTVSDCCGLVSNSDDRHYVKVNEAGTIHENVAVVLGFKSLLDDKYLPTYRTSNDEELAKWLTSMD